MSINQPPFPSPYLQEIALLILCEWHGCILTFLTFIRVKHDWIFSRGHRCWNSVYLLLSTFAIIVVSLRPLHLWLQCLLVAAAHILEFAWRNTDRLAAIILLRFLVIIECCLRLGPLKYEIALWVVAKVVHHVDFTFLWVVWIVGIWFRASFFFFAARMLFQKTVLLLTDAASLWRSVTVSPAGDRWNFQSDTRFAPIALSLVNARVIAVGKGVLKRLTAAA